MTWLVSKSFRLVDQEILSRRRNYQQAGSVIRSFRPRLEALEHRLLLSTDTWTGLGSDNNWMTATNWQGNIAPSPGDDLVFPVTFHPTVNNNFPAGTAFNSISISNGGPTFTGNAIVLNSGIVFQGLQCTINFASITLGKSQTFIMPSGTFIEDLHIACPVNLQGFTLTLDSEHADNVFGFMDGPISGSGNIVKAGRFDGEWDLTGNNTYSGLTTVNSGFLRVVSPNGLGSPSGAVIVNSGGVLEFSFSSPTSFTKSLTINGFGNGDNINGPFGAINGDVTTFTGPIVLGSDSLLVTGGTVSFANTISLNGSNLYVDNSRSVGSGNLIFTGTVNGPGTIFQGDPILGPTTPILSGTATFNASLTINKGTLSPGVTGPGILTTGTTTFQSGTTFHEMINSSTAGTGYSQLLVNGAVNLGGSTLATSLNFTPKPSTSFDIIESTGAITGTFNGLPDGASLSINGLPFLIHYTNCAATASNGVGPSTLSGRAIICAAPVDTMASVTASANPSTTSQSATLTVSVFGLCNAAAVATGGVGPLVDMGLPAPGTVQFMDGGTPLGGPITLNAGFASLTPMLSAGVHSITVVYASNSSNFNNTNTSMTPYSLTVKQGSVGWHDVVTGDFLGNGKQDIAGMTASGQWWLAVNSGSSFTNQLWGSWAPESPSLTWVDVHVGDFTGDGKADIVGRLLQNGQWWLAQSSGSSFTNQLWGGWSPNATWVDVKVGDFTGDGKPDLVGRYLQTGQWWMAQNTGSSFTNSLWATWNPAVTWVDINVGKFSGSTRFDLTGRYLQGGQWFTGVSTGSSFSTSLWATWNPAVTWTDVKVGDFNKDGKADITGRYLEGGQWFTGLSTGSSFTTTLWASWNPAVTWVDVQVGDFNGDGRADIVGRYLQEGSWWAGLSSGSGFATGKWGLWSPAANWVDVSATDLNGDGSTDLIGRYGAAGQWWAAISNGSTAFANQLWTTWAP